MSSHNKTVKISQIQVSKCHTALQTSSQGKRPKMHAVGASTTKPPSSQPTCKKKQYYRGRKTQGQSDIPSSDVTIKVTLVSKGASSTIHVPSHQHHPAQSGKGRGGQRGARGGHPPLGRGRAPPTGIRCHDQPQKHSKGKHPAVGPVTVQISQTTSSHARVQY